MVPFFRDHQIWDDDLSPVDLEAPVEEMTKMGIVVGFGWCVLYAGQSCKKDPSTLMYVESWGTLCPPIQDLCYHKVVGYKNLTRES
jgi:hypothetical protein